MKRKYFLIAICMMLMGTATVYKVAGQAKASVEITNTNNVYRFNSKYDKAKTKEIQQYMTESLSGTGFSFTNAQLDAQLSLTGGINFYIKSYPGELVLKFDKRKNNADDYTKFKKMCEGIKAIIQKN